MPIPHGKTEEKINDFRKCLENVAQAVDGGTRTFRNLVSGDVCRKAQIAGHSIWEDRWKQVTLKIQGSEWFFEAPFIYAEAIYFGLHLFVPDIMALASHCRIAPSWPCGSFRNFVIFCETVYLTVSPRFLPKSSGVWLDGTRKLSYVQASKIGNYWRLRQLPVSSNCQDDENP